MALEEHHLRPSKLIAGLDEAGRGCLAGPVVAAAVILPNGFSDSCLDDSKKLNEGQRNSMRHVLEKNATCFSVAFVYPRRIDSINILRASIEAMHMAVDSLIMNPELLLVDGNQFSPYRSALHECVIKGDGKYLCIAAASVLAKTYRDEYMIGQHFRYPQYGWIRNKGYPTFEHRKGIISHGSCSLHRSSFRLLPVKQLEMF